VKSLRVLSLAAATVALAALATPARAGIFYRAQTTTEAPHGRQDTVVVEARVEGTKSRIEFKEGRNPLTKAGTYLLTTDGGKTVYLVNPDEKTYAAWDIEAMARFAGNAMEGMGGLMQMDISDPKVEKLLEEDGGTIVGLPTRHYRYRTSYSMQIKIMGIKRATNVESVQDFWSTTDLGEAALGVWLRKEPPVTGNEQIDRLVRAEMEKVHGFPLKVSTVSTSVGQKGKESTTHTEVEVTELRRDEPAAPASTWEIPSGYQETQLLPNVE
jgi:Domain of unknown function (DUF4412)